jgi:hypothetical protein
MSATSRIYHYTNLDALALILKSGKIRFTRLDLVDDVREAQSHLGIDFGKYFFVSCWTTDATESIPQWNMYSDQMRGVRLELPEYPFQQLPMRPPPAWTGIESQGDIYGPIPFEELWGPTYFVAPMFLKREHFAGLMNYVDDVEAVYRAAIRREVQPDRNSQILRVEGLPLLPRNKSKDWGFQREFRFSLFILPSPPVPAGGPGHPQFATRAGTDISQAFLSNIDPGIAHFDVAIAPAALQSLVVRTGPLATPGAIATAEALTRAFSPGAQTERSVLSGFIRPRS